ncbi:MAG: hypothetical protein KDC27_12540, partial [Acidobacteria bacterium]|nr:hypothetical protein [Acidobacteriota bacterium]
MRDWPRRAPLLALFALGVAISAQTSREAILLVNIGDAATGEPTPARVWLTDARGETPPILGIEQLAVMWGRFDRPEGYALQPDGSFYADGAFQARLSPGDYTLRIEKGYEYEPRSETIEAKA